MSLRQLSDWCAGRFPNSQTPNHEASRLPEEVSDTGEIVARPFDLPWVVLGHTLASSMWDWQPTTGIESVLEEIATFADSQPQWIETSA